MRVRLRSEFTGHDLRRDYRRALLIARKQLNNETTRRIERAA